MKDVVRQVLGQIAAVRRDLEATATASKAEVARNQGLADRLGTAAQEVDALGGSATEILAGADFALKAAQEVLIGTQQIAAAAEQASGASAQAAMAAKEQARGAEDLAAAIEEIASLADELSTTET
jgi:methyl-accepting chemotaxis protein